MNPAGGLTVRRKRDATSEERRMNPAGGLTVRRKRDATSEERRR
jgi:hypothetical protein